MCWNIPLTIKTMNKAAIYTFQDNFIQKQFLRPTKPQGKTELT